MILPPPIMSSSPASSSTSSQATPPSVSASYIDASLSDSPPPGAAPSSSSSAEEVDSLPSSSASSSSSDAGSERSSDAQREWEASLQQLEMLLTMLVVPFLGKYFGRKTAFWGWARYMEWMYPVEVKVTNRAAFNTAGALEAAATL